MKSMKMVKKVSKNANLLYFKMVTLALDRIPSNAEQMLMQDTCYCAALLSSWYQLPKCIPTVVCTLLLPFSQDPRGRQLSTTDPGPQMWCHALPSKKKDDMYM